MLKQEIDSKHKNKKGLINSILIGIMLICNALSPLFSFIPNGLIIIIALPFLCLLFLNKSKIVNTQKLFFLYIAIYFAFSIIRGHLHPTVIKLLVEFIAYGFFFIYSTNCKYIPIYILRTIVVLGIVAIPVQLQIDYSSTNISGVWMNVSYNLIKVSIASMLLLLTDTSKFIKAISLFEIIAALIFLVVLGSRGAILGIVVSFVLFVIYRNNKLLKINSTKFWLIIILIAGFFFLFPIIARLIYNILNGWGISSYSLNRIMDSLISGTSMSEGRDLIYAKAISQIKNNIFCGLGIGAYDNYSGEYPHNLFIQILYEGGFVFGTPLLIMSIYALFMVNKKMDMDSRILIIYLIGAGYVQLMFSSYLWMSPIFWFLIGIALKQICVKSDK